MKIKVSILVPCYNVEKYIRQCMDSLVNQTLKEIEIICINDGSKDNTLKILKEYAQKDNRIKIIDKKNSGYGDSMNKGLEKASGEYIGIVESDDYAELDMFETLYNLCKEKDLDVIKSNFYFYFSQKKKNCKARILPPLLLEQIFIPKENHKIFYCMPSIWSMIYKREFLNKNEIYFLPTPGASYQDTAFNFKVWLMAGKASCISHAFIHYRQDNENSSIKSKSKVFCVCDEYKEMEKYAKIKEHYENVKFLLPRLKWKTYCWNFNRLGGRASWQFLKHFSEEFRNYKKEGLINETLFSKKDLRNLNAIISHPFKFFLQNYWKGFNQ